MSSTALCKSPSVDYFSLVTQRPQNIASASPFRFWDDVISNSEEEPKLESPNEDFPSSGTDSFLATPTSPASTSFPHPTYLLPRGSSETISSPRAKTQTRTLQPSALDNFGTVEDWMCWDAATNSESCDKALSLSPTSEYFPELKLEPESPVMNSINPRSVSITNDGNNFSDEQNLYSTPLAWNRPTMSAQQFALPQPRQQPMAFTTLSPSEEAKLRNIAMPQRLNSQSYPGSPSSASSPEQGEAQHLNRRKRKSSPEEEDYDEDDCDMAMEHEHHGRESSRQSLARKHQQPLKKTAHNMIEKRYRTNLNDKIAALRDSVPSLRVMVKKNSRGEDDDVDDGEEDLQGLTPAHKLNKATVLAKATEYIAHLEKRNKHICRENAQLKARVEAFEILMMSSTSGPNAQRQSQSHQQQQHQQQQQMRQNRPSRTGFELDGILG
ncbi:hypothetical protein BP6252_11487 [Coleophoma cylindrospora]|uniref:BHLH domain-containing protein n=1 Tax=Coleophoma cylindrospora TaxID=1849047 RepID=A0A3D8QKT6_9HELO|nr:hypothetical protein BP6252_11487 [Coleophoma cylindrospora]